MAKKRRVFDGVELEDNLYPHSAGRVGYWRYRRPDGTWKGFRCADVREANAIADDANARRHITTIDRRSMAYAVERYIEHAERIRPSNAAKQSWRNRCYAMRAFARQFPQRTVTAREVWSWFDTLTHSQQILREAEFRRMWQFFIRENFVACTDNPFARDQIQRREKPASQRERLSLADYQRIYVVADSGLQTAMAISLLTTLRRSDVLSLTRDNLQDGCLRITVSKSMEQRGEIRAARLEWRLADHPDLARVIQRALDTQPAGCSFLVHRKPLSRRHGEHKLHGAQILPDHLSKLFAKARMAAGIGGDNPPTFHEIRSLASYLLAQQGEQITDIQQMMAHGDESMTQLYQSGHPLPFQRVSIRLHAGVEAL